MVRSDRFLLRPIVRVLRDLTFQVDDQQAPADESQTRNPPGGEH